MWRRWWAWRGGQGTCTVIINGQSLISGGYTGCLSETGVTGLTAAWWPLVVLHQDETSLHPFRQLLDKSAATQSFG